MNRVSKAALAAALAVAATSYASPYWTLYQMRAALEARDADRFSRYVDYPALRESLKGQLTAALERKLGAPLLRDTPLAGIGQAIGQAVINTMIDTMVSPAGVMALMAGEKPTAAPAPSTPPAPPASAPAPQQDKGGARPQAQPEQAPGQEKKEAAREALRYALSYRGLNRVEASATTNNGERIVIGLARDGLWSWKWSSVALPDFAVPAR
ncbi:DUF2939 domain-containing protein [Cupriavidus sp. 30B13]|uniref:DUF2939 domain-containing protein n=1 Tax=Cupriavidus sp. 30B13 TaxID=3384241 RepID=UPI003B8FAED2